MPCSGDTCWCRKLRPEIAAKLAPLHDAWTRARDEAFSDAVNSGIGATRIYVENGEVKVSAEQITKPAAE